VRGCVRVRERVAVVLHAPPKVYKQGSKEKRCTQGGSSPSQSPHTHPQPPLPPPTPRPFRCPGRTPFSLSSRCPAMSGGGQHAKRPGEHACACAVVGALCNGDMPARRRQRQRAVAVAPVRQGGITRGVGFGGL